MLERRRARRRLASRDERLLRLLGSQRRQDARRGALSRGSREWEEATVELEQLNTELMHLASPVGAALEQLAGALDLDLDCRPEEDDEFRGSVLRSVREAMRARASDQLVARSADRLDASAARMESALAAIAQAEAGLRARYPEAVLDAWTSADCTLSVLADRDGQVA